MSDRTDLRRATEAHLAREYHGHRLGAYIQQIVYGGNDGIITTFAIVAGTVGADLPRGVIIVLGVANLLADGCSMAAGAYLSARAEIDQYERIYKEERQELKTHPDIEREEVRIAFEKKGFRGKELDDLVRLHTSTPEIWIETMMREEHGLAKPAAERPILNALMTFLAFVAFGCIPLLPYLLPWQVGPRFGVAIASTSAALIALGITRSSVTRQRLIRGPLEVLAVGLGSSAVAYAIGMALRAFANIAL